MNEEVDRQELDEAIYVALEQCKDDFAQSYLRNINKVERLYGDEGVGVQLMYCLSSMSYWRGEEAKRVKKIFRKWIEILKR